MSNDRRSRAATALEHIDSEIAAGNIAVYRNLAGEPFVSYRDSGSPGAVTKHLSLFDKDCRAWLTIVVWREMGELLVRQEVDAVLTALAGTSLAHPSTQITDPALWALVEREPVIATLVEFMHTRAGQRREGTMEEVWNELHTFAGKRGLLRRNGVSFPAGANVLSRKLRQFRLVLERLHIKVTLRRSNGCRVVIERLDDSRGESSAESSAVNSGDGSDLRPSDDRQRLLAALHLKKTETEHLSLGELT